MSDASATPQAGRADEPNLYGVVDPARAEALRFLLPLTGTSASCLYEEPLAPAVKAVCPHLVSLNHEPTLRSLWFNQGWGDSWGVLLGSRLEAQALRRRLRHFTLARLPDGEGPMLFRFWDPRVMRVYLPSCDGEELAPWFIGIDWWAAETAAGDGSLQYTLGADGLSALARGRPS